MSDAPLHEPPLQGTRWSRPWHLYFNGLKNWVTGLISAIKFRELSDVPQSYTGQAGKVVKVKSDETGLEFGTSGSGVTDHTLLTNIGVNTHSQLDSEKTFSEAHRANSLIHFEQADIDHTGINNIGIYTHDEIDIHIDRVDNPHQVTADQVLPSQTSNSGKYLTTNGTTASWGTVSAGVTDHTLLTNIGTNTHAQIDTHISNTSNPHSVTANQVLPSQGGNSGKYLTTDGTNTSWATVSAGVSGSGTTNTIPLWSGASTLSDSALTQSSGNVTCSGSFGVASGKVFKIDTTSVLDIAGTNVLRVGDSGTNTGTYCMFSGRTVGVNNPNNWNIYSGAYIAINTPTNIGNGYNVAFGGNILTSLTSGNRNTAIGISLFTSMTTGYDNFGAGFSTGTNITTGNNNVLIGTYVGGSINTGYNNTGFGTYSLASLTSGYRNVALGGESLNQMNTGISNVACGPQSGYWSTGSYNVFFGDLSGASNQAGEYNVFIGYRTMYNASVGFGSVSQCTMVGAFAGADTKVNGCVYIGYQAGTLNATANSLYIENSNNITTPLIYGDFSNKILKTNSRLAVGKQSITLGAGASTFAITRNYIILTGDAGSNTITTITGGVESMILVIKFVDSNVTITKDATTTADTVHMQATLNGSANTILTLWYDGNKWFELARSLN